MWLGRNGHDTRGRGVGDLGRLPHQGKQAVDEQKVTKAIDCKVAVESEVRSDLFTSMPASVAIFSSRQHAYHQ